MEKHYLTVNYDGTVFEYSGTQKEGFEPYANSKGIVSYRKYYNRGITGSLKWIEKVKNPHLHNREELNVVLEDNGVRFYLNFSVLGQKENIDTMTESLIRFLPLLERDSTYTLTPWCIKKGDVINNEVAKRTVNGVTVHKDGVKMSPALTYERVYQDGNRVDGDIPAIIFVDKMGSKKPSATSLEAKNDYLYNTLVSNADRLAFPNNSSSNQEQTTTPVQEKPKQEPTFKEEEHDLPF